MFVYGFISSTQIKGQMKKKAYEEAGLSPPPAEPSASGTIKTEKKAATLKAIKSTTQVKHKANGECRITLNFVNFLGRYPLIND